MALTRTLYDNCQTNLDTFQRTSTLDYMLDPNKHYNCSDCRIELGVFGGNNVSLSSHNLVDVESDLRNYRQLSNCPERKYLPKCCNCDPNYNDGIPCGSMQCRMRDQQHLKPCNMIQYAPRMDHTGLDLSYPGCNMCKTNSNGNEMKYPPQFNPVQWTGRSGVENNTHGSCQCPNCVNRGGWINRMMGNNSNNDCDNNNEVDSANDSDDGGSMFSMPSLSTIFGTK